MGGREISEGKKCKILLQNLMESVKDCQNAYGKTKTLLATEKDIRIQNLCSCWENALSHGLKTTSIFQNIVSGNLTTESTGPTFWEFAYQHLTGHEKERFSTLRYVYTDQGKTRALIRSALNERALERYISTWLGDTNGLFLRYESWALVRDNEASNLLPSMAAGLGSILFAVTVDSPDLNIVAPVETKSLQKTNEIIIAVPVAGTRTDAKPPKESKSAAARRKHVISFDDDEMESVSSNSSSSIKSPTVSLSEACLKHEEKEKQRIESIQAICNDSSYQRILHSIDPSHCNENNVIPVETKYIEPESPTKIKLYSPVLSTKTYPARRSSFKIDSPEFDSNISNRTDSKNPWWESIRVDSTTTTSSSSSAGAQPLPSHSSHAESMTSSITSAGQSTHSGVEDNVVPSAQLQELEQRCASLEEQIKTLTIENARLKSLHYNLVASRQTSRFFSISIPRVHLQRSDNPKRKKFFAYEIQIVPLTDADGEKWSLLRRYSEFHRLHKYLQKDNIAVKTVDFPPKKSFGNMNAEFVEQRRQRLQVYLLSVLSLHPEISRCNTRAQLEQAFPFFKPTHQML